VIHLGSIPAALVLSLAAAVGASERVRAENGRLWIECREASLFQILREIAAVVPMDVLLDEGVEDEKVSLFLNGVTTKAVVERLLESSKLNYALTLDPSDSERILKIYVGSGGGGGITAPLETEDELDAGEFLESPEAREALRELKSFLEQEAASETSESAESGEGVASEIEELLESILDLPASSLPAETAAPQEEANSPKPKEKEKPPQL
jgi:hypothetical protein